MPPNWGPPPWPYYSPYEMPRQQNHGLTIDDVMAGKRFFDEMEKSFKEKDKDDKEKAKRKKPEAPKVSAIGSFFFTLSCLMFFSLPAGMLQLALLNWFKTGVFAIH